MKQRLLLNVFCCLLFESAFSQGNVGIGTTTPNPKSILDIQSTSKGVLFPRMTTAQRNAIINPPDALHIYNTDEHCLNYFDSTYQIWNCYCDNCKTIVITITSNVCEVDFYDAYAKGSPSKKYVVNVLPGVIISGCQQGDTALSFAKMLFNADVVINNYGTIAGAGGEGGAGAIETGCSGLSAFALPGKTGGSAIATKAGVGITVNNHGIVAGGGGGGGGSGGNPTGYGGGGGGGAGMVAGAGGAGGGIYSSGPFGGCFPTRPGVAGSAGNSTTGGQGGISSNGGATGGTGGNRAMAGQNGSGNRASAGGLAGKAVTGGSGNVLTNISSGQSFGTVD